MFISPSFPLADSVALAYHRPPWLICKLSSPLCPGVPSVSNHLLYVMEFTGLRTCLPRFPEPLGTTRLYHIWQERMSFSLFKLWSPNAWASRLQAAWKRWRGRWSYNHKCVMGADVWPIEEVTWLCCRSSRWRASFSRCLLGVMYGEQLKSSCKDSSSHTASPPCAEVSNWSAKVKERVCVQEELLWMKEAQTSNFLCALSPSNGKAKPLCGYQESTQ